MQPLSRTSRYETEGEVQRDSSEQPALDHLVPVPSGSSQSSERTSPAPFGSTGRSWSHSLLAAASRTELTNRAGKASSEHSKTTMDSPSLSMPPTESKPEHGLSATIRNPRVSEDATPSAASPPSSLKSADGSLRGNGPPPTGTSTTATHTASVTTSSTPNLLGLPPSSPPSLTPNDQPNPISAVVAKSGNPNGPSHTATTEEPTKEAAGVSDGSLLRSGPRAKVPRSNSRDPRRFSGSTATSTQSDAESTLVVHGPDGSLKLTSADKSKVIGTIGVCALDSKARSRPSRSILTRLQGNGEFEVVVFGDKAILDEEVENWPVCDFLISFFSVGFPLDKAIKYVELRKPFVVNDLSMQKVLWDRRLCLRILDRMGVPTPTRIEVNRDGGPILESPDLAYHIRTLTGVFLDGPQNGTGGGTRRTKDASLTDDGDTLVVDGRSIKKPFVEKPVNGEDHNVMIYFPKSHEGGGGRRLFRKIGNKSSEFDPNLTVPRCVTRQDESYIYEQFLQVENAEDVKAYTVGPDFCHAETRKSPVVDGLVRRNNNGKELRYVTSLNKAEALMASKIATGFGQRICGFDLLRSGDNSFVIDVNGFSFVKDNNAYYDQCAQILREMFTKAKIQQERGQAIEETGTERPRGDSDLRTNTPPGHRSALKTILKSPSMSRLSNHIAHPHRHRHGAASPEVGSITVPLSSPPSTERKVFSRPTTMPAENGDILPPPILPPKNNTASDLQSPVATPSDKEKTVPLPASKHSWKLKGMVAVIRHADRTPKQKFKFTFHSQPFADLLKGHQEEVLLKGEAALASVDAAAKVALQQKLEDPDKLKTLRNAIARKGGQTGTKVQIKPMFRKRKPEEMSQQLIGMPQGSISGEPTIPENQEVDMQVVESPIQERPNSASAVVRTPTRHDSISGVTFSRFAAADNELVLDKLQLVMKWGGEPTHSARYQCQELGASMRDDLKLLNKEVLNDVHLFTSSENRVKTSAQIWAADFLGNKDLPEDFITVRKDLLDDSNAAKDVMDKVKKKLKVLLREGYVPEHFAWPKNTPEPVIVLQNVVELMKFHRRVLRHNFKKLKGDAAASLAAITEGEEMDDPTKPTKDNLTSASIQARWCTGEDAELFKERWEKLFTEFCDSEKVDPSKISELYDSMKFDAYHNKQFLEWVFMPSQSLLDEMAAEEAAATSTTVSPAPSEKADKETKDDPEPKTSVSRHNSANTSSSSSQSSQTFAQRIGLRRRSVLAAPPSPPPLPDPDIDPSYFKLYRGSGDPKVKTDKRLCRLRELYRYGKILFDYVGPQEYGISNAEKLEIGLLTSLPLLSEIVSDLQELQQWGQPKSYVYFTKESHIYTLLNCILEGGIETKIPRSAIPELDYLSQIYFELYESRDVDGAGAAYSIVIKISPGCYAIDPLDVSLDSKHAIRSAPRRSLTHHQEYREVIETLKGRFGTVVLPKSFLAVNVSEKNAQDGGAGEGEGGVEGVEGRE